MELGFAWFWSGKVCFDESADDAPRAADDDGPESTSVALEADLESQQPPDECEVKPAETVVARARLPSISFSVSFCASLVVIWAGLVAMSFARDSTPSECDATSPNIANITISACDAAATNATNVATKVTPSRFVRLILDQMSAESCGCADEDRIAEMYFAPTSVIFSAAMVYVVFVIVNWARRIRSDLQADLDKANARRDDSKKPSLLLRLLFCLRSVEHDADAQAPPEAPTGDDDGGTRIAEGMSLIYTHGHHIVQAQVLELRPEDVKPGWRRGKAKLKIIRDEGIEKEVSGLIDLIENTLTIDKETYDVAVDSSPDALLELFLAILHTALAYWGIYNYIQLAPDRAGSCWLVHIVLMPVFKPIAPSMWMALMSVGQFVLWHAMASTPGATRRATKTKLTGAPLPINVVTYVCVYATALPLLVWFAAAVPFFLMMLIVPLLWPLLIVNMLVLPVMLVVGLPFCLTRAERVLARCVPSGFDAFKTREADPTDDDQARSLMLKVFATIM